MGFEETRLKMIHRSMQYRIQKEEAPWYLRAANSIVRKWYNRSKENINIQDILDEYEVKEISRTIGVKILDLPMPIVHLRIKDGEVEIIRGGELKDDILLKTWIKILVNIDRKKLTLVDALSFDMVMYEGNVSINDLLVAESVVSRYMEKILY